MAERKAQRRKLSRILQSIAKAQMAELEAYSRQVPYEDAFGQVYSGLTPVIINPPYAPERMYKLYEENGVVSSCIEAIIGNVDGFGHDIVPVDGVDGDAKAVASSPEQVQLEQFFSNPNDRESMIALRQKLRRDKLVTGNAYLEIVRDREGFPFAAFWADARRMRLCKLTDPVLVDIQLERRGTTVTAKVEKQFRKFCMIYGIISATGEVLNKIRYFKEFGDPRLMDAKTGKYLAEGEVMTENMELATELIHFKHGNDIYGIPQWVGVILAVMGMSKADFVNYDLFDSQGIPPLLILLSGGQLTDESFDDLVALFQKAKGAQSFNKLLLLEAESTSTSIDGKELPAKLEVKPMSEARKEDAMFLSYLTDSRESIRMFGFRLPGMFLGATKDEKHETAFVARMLAEEQIFSPERVAFDEIINATIVRDFGGKKFKFQSLGPVLQSNPEILALLPVLIESGVFSVNQLIAFVNNQFNLTLEPYKESWANEPIKPKEPTLPGEGKPAPKDGKSMTEKNDKIYAALQELEDIAKRYVLRGCADAGCKHSH